MKSYEPNFDLISFMIFFRPRATFTTSEGLGITLSRYGNRCIENETECATCFFDEFLCVFLFPFVFLILLKMEMQINSDLNICQYFCLHMKFMDFTLWFFKIMHVWDKFLFTVIPKQYRMLKSSLFLIKMRTSRTNN